VDFRFRGPNPQMIFKGQRRFSPSLKRVERGERRFPPSADFLPASRIRVCIKNIRNA